MTATRRKIIIWAIENKCNKLSELLFNLCFKRSSLLSVIPFCCTVFFFGVSLSERARAIQDFDLFKCWIRFDVRNIRICTMIAVFRTFVRLHHISCANRQRRLQRRMPKRLALFYSAAVIVRTIEMYQSRETTYAQNSWKRRSEYFV